VTLRIRAVHVTQEGHHMSNQFQVDTDRIAAASGDINRIGADIDTQVAAMMARLTGLQDAWRGTASSRFQAVAHEWRGTQARVREALGEISHLLAQAGQQYAAAEQQNTSMFA
jgi:early secretory antigenic target protein ESAT-6